MRHAARVSLTVVSRRGRHRPVEHGGVRMGGDRHAFKFEIRNSKQTPMRKPENQKTQFGYFFFLFLICFEFRISNFVFTFSQH